MIGFSDAEKERFETKLSEYLADDRPLHEELTAAMRYSALSGGKRLRPYLLVTFCRLFGGDFESALPFACALEMIHTYSLIHDDLPAMDNDDLRRGKATNHKVFGEAAAILAGDALQAKAFEIMLSKETVAAVGAQRAAKAAAILAEKAGVAGMCGGQGIDLMFEGKTITPEILLEMELEKTGALLSAAAGMGAVLAGAAEDAVETAERYAENLGVAFQITDDLLDLTGREETFGKPIGSDLQNQKSTYVSLYGAAGARAQAALYTDKAKAAASLLPGGGKELSELADQLIKRTY